MSRDYCIIKKHEFNCDGHLTYQLIIYTVSSCISCFHKALTLKLQDQLAIC